MLRLSLALVSIVYLLPRGAAACQPELCPPPLAGVVELAPANTAEVPTDGVVVLRAEHHGLGDPQELQDRTTLAVSRDGEPVAGALEATDFDGLLIWRPAAPLQPGATYQASGSVDNPAGNPDECGPDELAIAFEFTAAAGPAAPLVPAELGAVETYFDEPVLSLTAVVCCDDAFPYDQVMCGESLGVSWSKGQCASTATRGHLRVQLTGKPGVDPATASQWVRVLRSDGEPVASGLAITYQRDLEAPTCLAIDQRSLATGEVAAGEPRCFGDEYVDRLGERPLDPAEALAGMCVTDLYTCEVDEGAWDPLLCKSWGVEAGADSDEPTAEPEPTAGCACRGDGSAPPLGPLVLALLALRRRARA
jgi:MYXO-CTERM domain-containing protein